jgi:hypothetical protein
MLDRDAEPAGVKGPLTLGELLRTTFADAVRDQGKYQ